MLLQNLDSAYLLIQSVSSCLSQLLAQHLVTHQVLVVLVMLLFELDFQIELLRLFLFPDEVQGLRVFALDYLPDHHRFSLLDFPIVLKSLLDQSTFVF